VNRTASADAPALVIWLAKHASSERPVDLAHAAWAVARKPFVGCHTAEALMLPGATARSQMAPT